mmetsp:Transcript_31863/g.54359  ORF Transcript_31863/g.54359 Transcript_31863/m.54359 type:complete len:594 (+) Transcript_31863:108-1889(+)
MVGARRSLRTRAVTANKQKETSNTKNACSTNSDDGSNQNQCNDTSDDYNKVGSKNVDNDGGNDGSKDVIDAKGAASRPRRSSRSRTRKATSRKKEETSNAKKACKVSSEDDSKESSNGDNKGSSNDGSNDVIYARGAAAQTTTHPGNLYFYQLCEERHDEFAALDVKDTQSRKKIMADIVDKIMESGGKFRNQNGGVLPRRAAMEKTRDRLRQISKPKFRPTGFGENDVVFCRGAALFLYPGNARWRDLVDGHARAYFYNLLPDGTDPKATDIIKFRKKNGKFKKGNTVYRMKDRFPHRTEIAEKIMQIIHDRGGKFLDADHDEVCREEVLMKIHSRFKDLKKDFLSGKRPFLSFNDTVDKDEEKALEDGEGSVWATVSSDGTDGNNNDGVVDNTMRTSEFIMNRKILTNRKGGFTTVKNTFNTVRELRQWEKDRSRKRSKKLKMSKQSSQRKRKIIDESEDDSFEGDDDVDSDSGDESSDDESDESLDDDDQDAEKEMEAKRIKKEKQDADREARLKRRKSGVASQYQPQDPPKKKARRHSKSKKKEEEEEEEEEEEKDEAPVPEPPLSDYEKYRLEKIRRNKQKLAELGLL